MLPKTHFGQTERIYFPNWWTFASTEAVYEHEKYRLTAEAYAAFVESSSRSKPLLGFNETQYAGLGFSAAHLINEHWEVELVHKSFRVKNSPELSMYSFGGNLEWLHVTSFGGRHIGYLDKLELTQSAHLNLVYGFGEDSYRGNAFRFELGASYPIRIKKSLEIEPRLRLMGQRQRPSEAYEVFSDYPFFSYTESEVGFEVGHVKTPLSAYFGLRRFTNLYVTDANPDPNRNRVNLVSSGLVVGVVLKVDELFGKEG